MMKKMNPYPLGARREAGGICFSFVSVTADCGIILYDALTGEERQRIPFAEEDRVGEIYCKLVENIRPEQVMERVDFELKKKSRRNVTESLNTTDAE